jgi:hypothetical protein
MRNLSRLRSLSTALAGALLLGSACLDVTPPGVFFATQPPGARIVLNDVDSGFVTPCLLAVDKSRAHEVRLELQGYEPRAFRIERGRRVMIIPWYHAVTPELVHFPLFARTEDLLAPIRIDKNLVPGRIYVRLHPLGVD